ncbi:MAG: cupin domain-containing protein [Sandarakinorhabdus sp.]|nr:cupin domain-containing protein [Sandarakinorhabdus sp.]
MSDPGTKLKSVVVGPGEGRSYWQPLPSRGYVDVNLTPDNMPYDSFSSGTQLLPPGCMVREHGHRQNHELVFIYEGEGEVEIDGAVSAIVPGTTVLFARNCNWFHAIGRPRRPGEAMPDAFDRPADVQAVMDRMRFLPPRTAG